jgi:hypothetical protein
MAENRNWDTHFGESLPHLFLKNLYNGLRADTNSQTEGQKNRHDIEHKVCLYTVETALGFKALYLQHFPERILQKSKITYGQVPIKAVALCWVRGWEEVQKAFIT